MKIKRVCGATVALVGTVLVASVMAQQPPATAPATRMAAAPQPAVMVDNPAYAAWAKHQPGTTAVWTQTGSGSRTDPDGRKFRTVISPFTFTVRLLEVKPDGAVLEVSQESFRGARTDRVTVPPHIEESVPVMPLPSSGMPQVKAWKEGTEQLEVGGKMINTRTREGSAALPDDGVVAFKEWTAEGVPGALVKLETRNRSAQGNEGLQTLALVEFHEAGEQPASAPAVQPRPIAGVGRMMGTVVSVSGTTLVLKPISGPIVQATALTMEGSVEYQVDGAAGTLADVNAGMTVSIGPASPRSGKETRVMANSPNILGRMVRVQGNAVVISVRSDPRQAPAELSVPTDEHTQLVVNTKDGKTHAGKLDELRPDMTVMVIPPTGTARRIVASDMPLPTPPGGSRGAPTTRPAGMP